MVQYKQAQAEVRRTVRQAKGNSGEQYCDSMETQTPIEEICGMIKKMGGDRREWSYPVMIEGNETAVTNIEKVEMLAKAFVKINSSNNLSEEGKEVEKEQRKRIGVVGRKNNGDGGQEAPFNMGELQRALNRVGKTASGKDQVCYSMLKHLSLESQEKLLMLYNRVWEEGRLPKSWKEAVIIPIRKPGKDPSRPGNYQANCTNITYL